MALFSSESDFEINTHTPLCEFCVAMCRSNFNNFDDSVAMPDGGWMSGWRWPFGDAHARREPGPGF